MIDADSRVKGGAGLAGSSEALLTVSLRPNGPSVYSSLASNVLPSVFR